MTDCRKISKAAAGCSLRAAVLVLLALGVPGAALGEGAVPDDEFGKYDSVLEQIPDEFRKPAAGALERAGKNAAALTGAFKKLKKDEREGWAFLVANMQAKDLKAISEPALTEHIKYAYKARSKFQWTNKLSRELFFHYVLPIRSAQEPLEVWRKQFYEAMAPRLKKARCKTLEDAALEVNRYCGEKVKFKSTGPEDRGPLEVLESGYGRCEEEMIFFNAVARSAGVPARSVYTPYWPFQDNNHAWCEVYTGKDTRPGAKGWHYLGACEPAETLDRAWFTNTVKRAALVIARCTGIPEGENILQRRDKTVLINSTPVYTTTCRMTLEVVTAAGYAAPGSVVYLYVYNFGSLKTILGNQTDGQGRFTFDLGAGDYIVTATGNGAFGWAVAHSVPGEEASCEIVLEGPPPGGTYWLRYPLPGSAGNK